MCVGLRYSRPIRTVLSRFRPTGNFRFQSSLENQGMESFVNISEDDIKKVLCYQDLIPVIEKAFGEFSKGQHGGVIQPARIKLPAEKNSSGNYYVMPCSYNGVLTTKLVTQFPENKEHPRIQSVITMHDAKNGCMKAILAANLITTSRTAAMSAVATKYIAPVKSKVLAILGAGAQARSHIHALHSLNTYAETRIWNRTFSKGQALANELGCKACETAEEAVKDADVIVTATGSSTPVLKSEWVKMGAHINCVGGNRPSWQELDPKLMLNSVVYTDTKESALQESGDIILSKCNIYAEIGDIVNGTKEAKIEQTTVFKCLGMAVMDAAASKLMYETHCQTIKK